MSSNQGTLSDGTKVGTLIGFRYILTTSWDITDEAKTKVLYDLFALKNTVSVQFLTPNKETLTRTFEVGDTSFLFESVRKFKTSNVSIVLTQVTVEGAR